MRKSTGFFVILDLRIDSDFEFLKDQKMPSGVWVNFGIFGFTIGISTFLLGFIDFAILIYTKKWCYFNVNKPIEPLKLLEKSSILSRYRDGKVELLIIEQCFFYTHSGFLLSLHSCFLQLHV